METMEKYPKLDRRAVRSKRLILGAFRELVLEKDYKKITVSDIVERADIGRATFYAHFEDKEDLARFLFLKLLEQIEQEIREILNDGDTQACVHQTLLPSFALFRIAEEKHRWFKMNASNPEIGLGMLVKPLVKRFETQVKLLGLSEISTDIPLQTAATFLVSALVSILTDWVINDMPLPPENMDQIYQSLAEPNLSLLFII